MEGFNGFDALKLSNFTAKKLDNSVKYIAPLSTFMGPYIYTAVMHGKSASLISFHELLFSGIKHTTLSHPNSPGARHLPHGRGARNGKR